jgi:hypothetical protein
VGTTVLEVEVTTGRVLVALVPDAPEPPTKLNNCEDQS